MSRRGHARARVHTPYRQPGPRPECGRGIRSAVSCPDAARAGHRRCLRAAGGMRGTAGVRRDAGHPDRRPDRRALRPASRPARGRALRADEHRRAARSSARRSCNRSGGLVRAAPLTPALLPVGSSCVGGLPCAYALRLGCGLSASTPCPAPADSPRLMYARVVRRHPARGTAPGVADDARCAHAISRARGRRPVLALLARRRLALHAAQRQRARRGHGAAAGDQPASRGRLGGGHGGHVRGPAAVRRLERPLRRRVAAVRRRDPGGRPRRLAHAPRVLGGAGLARQPAGARDRTPALVEAATRARRRSCTSASRA